MRATGIPFHFHRIERQAVADSDPTEENEMKEAINVTNAA